MTQNDGGGLLYLTIEIYITQFVNLTYNSEHDELQRMINGSVSKLTVCMKKSSIVWVIMYKYYAIFSLVLCWINGLPLDPKWRQIKGIDQATWLKHNTPESKHFNFMKICSLSKYFNF